MSKYSTYGAKMVVLSQLAFASLTARVRNNREDRGATAVEYGLLVALVAAVIVAAVVLFGSKINEIFTGTTAKIPTPSSSTTTAPVGG
ncbi:MAG TPA: Flp family type IVb pilin [Jatrophihabitantaceae bacterium]|nr:Flp family type IVb pilin [Jatrophihabitantaceae bacterium]